MGKNKKNKNKDHFNKTSNKTQQSTPVTETSFDDGDNKLPADTAYQICERILKKYTLRVVNGIIWKYDPEFGYFKQLSEENAYIFIEGEYTSKEERLAKPNLAKEIHTRICRKQNLQYQYSDFNIQEHALNCLNGVVFVTPFAIDFQPHNPKYAFTYVNNAEYLENPPKAPEFKKYCKTSLENDNDKIQLLLEIMGYCFSDFTKAKKAFFLKGAPDSGKSKIAEFMQNIVGIENVSHIALHQLGDRFCTANLFGKKLNIMAEMKNTKLKDIQILKSVTGGDRISAEFKHQNIFTFNPTAKLVFAGNNLPVSEEVEATKAFMNRICLLVFSKSIPKENQDPNLSEKLWAERNVIFTRALNTLPDLLRTNFRFTVPEDTKTYLNYYESSSNSLDQFINDYCELDPEASVPAKEFKELYQAFCRANLFQALGVSDIATWLMDKYGIPKKRPHHKDDHLYRFMGIKICK